MMTEVCEIRSEFARKINTLAYNQSVVKTSPPKKNATSYDFPLTITLGPGYGELTTLWPYN